MRSSAFVPGRREPAEGTDAWNSGRAFWHIGFGLVLGIAVIMVISDGSLSATNRWGSVALAAALGINYLITGRTLILRDERTVARYLAFVVPAVLISMAMLMINPVFFVLLWVIFPQAFATSPRLAWGVAGAAMLGVAWAVASARWDARRFSTEAWMSGLLQGAVGFASSVALGWWIMRIITESGQRAALIDELETTRGALAAAHREAGIIAERDRLAVEIHDTLAQGFTSIVMLLQAADHELGHDVSIARRHIGSAERTARENLSEARALLAALQPVGLQTDTLPDAIRRIATRCAEDTGLDVDLEVTGQPRLLEPNQEVAVLRSAQEALANVRKHADAETVRLRLRYDGEATTLTVTDDGTGFDPAAVPSGFGLHGLRARVEQVGGRAEVHSTPGEGTTVIVSLA